MRYSALLGRTLREAPSDADSQSHQLVLRAGLARPLLAGGFALLPLGMRVLRNIEAIMHDEMAHIDAQEFRTPVIQSAELWQQTGRFHDYGPLMLRLTDRSERSLIFAPTHEEAIAELARRDITSYRQLPAVVYQIHTKYRDEMRPRNGLVRTREFTMLDAYSLDATHAGLDAAYEQLAQAFESIFERCGVQFVKVSAATGEMGGREACEYMALSASGEDSLAICKSCNYAANVEIAVAQYDSAGTSEHRMEEVATPNCTTIAEVATFLGVPEAATAKAVFFDTPEHGFIFVVIRGDLEVNEIKLRALLGVSELAPATAEQIAASGAVAGYASPVGLSIRTDLESADEDKKIIVVADQSVVAGGGLVSGANREGYHLQHVVYGRDWQATITGDVATVRAGDACAQCGAPLALDRGVEIGHIFKLGTRYTEALGATYLDQTGVAQPVVMGSYGIGLERLLQIVVEQHHDDAGIIWPSDLTPFDVHLVLLGKKGEVRVAGDELYAELRQSGLRMLYDDRQETPGVKFNDADLIGLPLRMVISERLLSAQQIEIKPRSGEAIKVARDQVIETIRTFK
ncbi:MAG: proline--tRNA ligase [Chloroflexota bacterium]